MLYIFGIETTRNCGSTNKQANKKNSTYKNRDLRKLFKKYQNFELKKTQKLCIVEKKILGMKSLRINFYIFVPNFRALGSIIFFLNRFGPTNLFSFSFLLYFAVLFI